MFLTIIVLMTVPSNSTHAEQILTPYYMFIIWDSKNT